MIIPNHIIITFNFFPTNRYLNNDLVAVGTGSTTNYIAFTRKGQNPLGILELRQVKGVRITIFHSGKCRLVVTSTC